jgi:steroid delta-isomerase-like uncharacterized protein
LNRRPNHIKNIKRRRTISTEKNKAVSRRIYEEAFNKGNLSIADEVIAKNWVYHGAEGMELKGPEGFKQFVTMYRTAFPDLHITADDLIAEGDKVATVGTYRGTFKGPMMGIPPTGKQCKGPVIAISRFEGGKEAEVLEVVDMLSMFQQLGIIPPMGPPGK